MEQKTSNCSDWKAVHDFMPPGPARLRVTGQCTFPTPGYTVTLKKHEPQGINPAILILDKVTVAPTGVEPQLVTKLTVAYRERTDQNYREVLVLPDNVTIPVKEVD
jgi:hypothetical protein